MDCDRAREAVSARIDGEDSGVPDSALAAHLSGCAACRAWEQRAHAVTRRARLGGAFLDHDLTRQVLAAVPPAPGRRVRSITQRVALAAVAATQLAITVPLLILGHNHDAGVHAAHELGSFDLALAIAFCVGALRPALSAGLAWPCCVASGGLVATALIDMIGGQAFGLDEAQHLIALAGALLLAWQARTLSRENAGPAMAAGPGEAGPQPAVYLVAGPPEPEAPARPFGGGTDAARVGGARPEQGDYARTGHARTPRGVVA
ncbi:MAG: Permease [Actinomycetia bacterium]|nr:Permease [Actinomycetes bacterium]